jgi:uncharacterized protein YrrD
LNASDVIGRRITTREGGQEIGKVKDLAVDPTGREVLGIVLSDGLLSGTRVALWKAVQAVGPDSVVLDSAGSVVKAKSAPEIKAVLGKKSKVKGLKLLTNKGKDLGKITDTVFDEATGDIIGYELSSSLFADAFDGTPFMPTPSWMEFGEDVAFVAPEVEATVVPVGSPRGPRTAAAAPPVPPAMPATTQAPVPGPESGDSEADAAPPAGV